MARKLFCCASQHNQVNQVNPAYRESQGFLTLITMIDPFSGVPAYQQLAALLREEITSGKLAAGQRVPSAKTLAQHHGIAIGTVMKAFNLLRDEGLIVAVPGRGFYVRPD